MNPLLSVATAQQIGEARIVGPRLAEIIGAEFAVSGHPANGIRPFPDELAELIATFIAPEGKLPSKWSYADLAGFSGESLYKDDMLVDSDFTQVTIKLPFKEKSSYLMFQTNQPHPRYGNGLFVLQTFPVTCKTEEESLRLAMLMNDFEIRQRILGYGFGSYCIRDKGLYFVSFYPNCVYGLTKLTNLYYSAGVRSYFVESILDYDGRIIFG